MKPMIFLLGILFVSVANAGEFYSIESLWSNSSPSYAPGDIVYCSGLDTDRKIGLGCVNLNIMKNYSIKTDTAGKITLRSLKDEKSVNVGQVDIKNGKYILDEMTSGYMSKVSLENATAKLEANLLVRKKLSLNDQIGCQGIFDCDWRVLYPSSKVSIEIKLNNQRLEKVPLN